jgi:hypothetical protein
LDKFTAWLQTDDSAVATAEDSAPATALVPPAAASTPAPAAPVPPREPTLFDIDAEDFGAYASIAATFTVTNAATWKSACDAINADWDGKNYVINVTGTFTIPLDVGLFGSGIISLRGSGTIWQPVAPPIVETGNGGDDPPSLFIVFSKTLILRGVNLVGVTSRSNGPIVMCSDGGKLIMRSGTISGSGQRAVSVESSGTFTMYGGTISGNKGGNGGGVSVINGGTFTMHGGTIKDNTAGRGGAVYVGSSRYSTSTFTKTGGVIYGDTNAAHTAGANENTATEGASGWGHAVFWVMDGGLRPTGSGASTTIDGARYRDATLTETDNLSTNDTATNWGAYRELN